MRPVYSCTMDGCVVCFTGFKDKEELVSQATITLRVTLGLELIWFAVSACRLCIVHTYICVHICVYICKCAHLYVCTYVCVHMCKYVHMYVCTFVRMPCHVHAYIMYLSWAFWHKLAYILAISLCICVHQRFLEVCVC